MKIVIHVEGGVVQNVWVGEDAVSKHTCRVIDCDTQVLDELDAKRDELNVIEAQVKTGDMQEVY